MEDKEDLTDILTQSKFLFIVINIYIKKDHYIYFFIASNF